MKKPRRKPQASTRRPSKPASAGKAKSKSASSRHPARKTNTAKERSAPTKKPRKARLKPIVHDETETLLHLEELLGQRIVGKEDAITRVANTIRIRRANLDFRPARPDGSFLLVGPSGVGKTEFACAAADVLLGSENRVVLLDMADYTEEEDLEDLLVTVHPEAESMLIQGTLTTPVRNDPRSIILFRGLEKAHPTVRRLLLHILERGTLVDAQGEVGFKETIVFATTRLKPEETETVEQIGFKRSVLTQKERWRKFLEDQFSPEFLSAFNEVLFFERLTPRQVRLIARYKVKVVLDRLKRQRRGVEVSDKVYDTFIKEDEVRQTGARDLNRTLEEKIFTPLSKYLLSHADARQIRVEIQGNRVVIKDKTP
jgi:ATP-dependent Clp protease ATP-binding subunit ClpA